MKILLAALGILSVLGIFQAAHADYGDLTLTSPSYVDSSGHTLNGFHVGQQIGVESALTNHGKTEQKFTYIVQVLDHTGSNEYLQGFSASLLGNQSFTASQVWIPKSTGQYTIQVYIWDSLADAIPLTNVIQKTLTITS